MLAEHAVVEVGQDELVVVRVDVDRGDALAHRPGLHARHGDVEALLHDLLITENKEEKMQHVASFFVVIVDITASPALR